MKDPIKLVCEVIGLIHVVLFVLGSLNFIDYHVCIGRCP